MANKSAPPPKSRPKSVLAGLAIQKALGAGNVQADQSERQAIKNVELAATATVPPASIQWRKRVRKVNLLDVHARGLSIHALTLLQPLVVVNEAGGTWIVDGGHRLMAMLVMDTPQEGRRAVLERMADYIQPLPDPKREVAVQALIDLPYKPYPTVKVHHIEPREMMDIGGMGPELLAELAANLQRKGYSTSEIREMAEALKASGFTLSRGRRAKGGPEVSIQRLLQDATGKSATTIWRILNGQGEEGGEAPSPSPAKAPTIRREKLYSWLDAQSDRSSLQELRDRIDARLSQLGN